MSGEVLREVARAHAVAERAQQGLGPTLTDPATIERLAELLTVTPAVTVR